MARIASIPTAADTTAARKGRFIPLVVAAAIVALPVLSLVPLGINIHSADSTALLAIIRYVRSVDASWLVDSQDPPLPHALYGLWTGAFDDPNPLVIVPALGTIALAVLTGAFVLKRTGRPALCVMAATLFAALGVVMAHVRLLPLYPWFTVAGTAGVWIWVRFLRGRHGLWGAAACGALVLISVAAHGEGLYFFLMVPAGLVLVRDRDELMRYARGLAVFLLVLSPWLVTRLAVGPLDDGFAGLSPRSTWVINQRYHQVVIDEFWEQSVQEPEHVVTRLAAPVPKAMGWAFWVVVALALVGLGRISPRERIFAGLGLVVLLVPMVFLGFRLFPRYFYPGLPAGSMLAGLGAEGLISWISKHRPRVAPPAAWAAAGIAVALLGVTWWGTFVRARDQHGSKARADLYEMADRIGPGEVVLGRRSASSMMAASTDFVYLFPDLLSEREYVSFLLWREPAVRALYDRHDIGWVVLQKPHSLWEERYNALWLTSAYGAAPVHAERLAAGRMSCLAHDGITFELFAVDPARREEPAEKRAASC